MRKIFLLAGFCLAMLAHFAAAQTAKPDGQTSSSIPPDDGLTLSLSLDTAKNNPPLVAVGTQGIVNPCLIDYPLLACVPLILTLENRGKQAIRSGLMTCGERPISFELQEKDGSWRELLPAPNKGFTCFATMMKWQTVPAGGSYALPIKIADDLRLDMSSLQGEGPYTLRVGWNVYGCLAANNLNPQGAAPPSGTNRLLWDAQCIANTSPVQNYARLISNPITVTAIHDPLSGWQVTQAVQSTVHVRVPTALNIVRTPDAVSVSIDQDSFEPVELTTDAKLVTGVMYKLYVYPLNTPRPSQPDGTGLSSGTDFNLGTVFLNSKDHDLPAPGQPFVVEMDLSIIETPVPPQHMWPAAMGANYRILWQRVIKQETID